MYGEIYHHNYIINDTGDQARVSIRKKNYNGNSTYVDAGVVPFIKSKINNEDDLIGGIYPTSARVQLLGTQTFGMDDIYTASETEFQVVHLINGEVDWIGFITPESFSELDTNDYRYMDIRCFDGLTRLKNLKFLNENGENYGALDPLGGYTFLFAIKEALKKTGLELDILSLVDRLPVTNIPDDTQFIADVIFGQQWIYSFQFNSIDPNLLKEGVFFSYHTDYEEWKTIARVDEIDRTGSNVGIKINPPFAGRSTGNLFGSFFEPNGDVSKDVLAEATHNALIWIDPDKRPDSEDKFEAEKKYYELPNGTWNCWDVLNAIALAFDFKITQNKGVWVLEAMDVNRIGDAFFHYDYDGEYIGRVEQEPTIVIPCEPTELLHKKYGNTRYVDKVLKSVNVGYRYRYKADGDPLSQLLDNGSFWDFPNPPPPADWTPPGWERQLLRDRDGNFRPITFNISRPSIGAISGIQISSPQDFNQFNRLRSNVVNGFKDDVFELNWGQSVEEANTSTGRRYLTLCIEFIGASGDVYYLVNAGEEDGWESRSDANWFTSGSPKGRWLKSDGNYYHFNSNYSTGRYTGSGYGYSAMSEVHLKMPPLPEDGSVALNIVGSCSVGERIPLISRIVVNCYVVDYDKWEEEGEIHYIDNSYGSRTRVTWNTNIPNVGTPNGIRIGWMHLGVIPSGSQGTGRMYEYTQSGEYFDRLDGITLDIGDEDNDNHLSAVKIGSKVISNWVSRDGSLYVGTLGMMLARSIMRRYQLPKKMIDGGISFYPTDLISRLQLWDLDGTDWYIKNGDVSSVEHSFNGTLYQMLDGDLPFGGVDHGANSMDSRSGSGSGGGSSSGGGSTGIPIASPTPDLQGVTEKGNTTSLDIVTKGTRNAELLAIPDSYPSVDDRIAGETYLHADNDYLFVNNVKARSGFADLADRAYRADEADYALDSDKWDGNEFDDFLDQPVRATDNVQFEAVQANSGVFNNLLLIPQTSNAAANALWKSGAYAMLGNAKVWAGQADLWNGLAQPDYLTQPVRPNDSPKFEGVGSQSFASGFAGHGYRLAKDTNDDYLLEVDRMLVRKDFSVYELIVDQIRATNGSIWVSDAIKITDVTVSGANFVCEIDTDNGTIGVPFVVNDIVRCQVFNGTGLKYYTAQVVSVTSGSFAITKLEGASNPANGDELVRIGNATDIDRQGALYLTSSDSGSPFLDVVDGVVSASLENKTKVRLGKLDGIVDPDFGALSGYGIYAENGFFKGRLQVTAGSNVYTKSETDGEIDTLRTETNTQFNVLEGEINSKVSQTEFDDLDERVGTAETSITQNATDILQRATKTEVTTEVNTAKSEAISTASADATAKANNAKSEAISDSNDYTDGKVSDINEDITSITTRVTNAETAIDQNADEILLRATKTEVTTEVSTAKSEAISTAASDATTKANNAESNAITTSETYTNSQISILSGEIALKADQTVTDGLDTRLSSAELKITPEAINLTVSAQVDDKVGGLEDEVRTSFDMTSNQISLLGKDIVLTGKITFNSLDTGAQGQITTAQDTADTALVTANTANTDLSTLQGSLGGLAYEDLVSEAQLDSTIIDGGYIRANLIDVENIFAQNVTATGQITALDLLITGNSKIGGFKIDGNSIVNEVNTASLLFNSLEAGSYIRINESLSSPLISLRTDQQSRVGLNIQTYGNNTTGLSIINNASGAGGRAITSYGGHEFAVRGSEFWDAPGVLGAAIVRLSDAHVYQYWAINTLGGYISKQGSGTIRWQHNLGHTDYVVIASPQSGYAGAITVTPSRSTNYLEVTVSTSIAAPAINITIFGRNRL